MDGFSEGIAEAVGHGVIDGDIVAERGGGWIGLEVGDAVGEGGCDGETGGCHVVLHVVLRGVGEDDGRFGLADD